MTKQTCDDRDIPHQYEIVGYRWINEATPPSPRTAAVLVCMKCLDESIVPLHETLGGKRLAA